jgi:hypothetical protein
MKAFPTLNWVHQHGQPPNDEGMDLRDYFAAKAMQSLSNNNDMEDLEDVFAEQAYRIADAMMKARKQ